MLFVVGALQACGGPSSLDLENIAGVSSDTPKTDPTIITNSVSFDPTTYDYGNLLVLSADASKTFIVTNQSTQTMYMGSVTGGNTHFTVTANTCSGQSLLTGTTCSISVKFAPLSSGVLSALISVGYDTAPASSSLTTTVPLSGTGVTGFTFAGIDLIDNIKTTSARLNWTPATGASGYQVFNITNNTSAAVPSCSGSCSYTVTGLTPNTPYTFRVRAIDSFGLQDTNTNDQLITTKSLGSFTNIVNLAANENVQAQTALLDCHDSYGGIPSYSITAQSDSASNCTIAAGRVSCTPSYKSGHASWNSNVTVSCDLNGSTYTQSFQVTVSDTNRPPTIALVPSVNQSVIAASGTSTFDASGSSDLDGDSITYSCTFSGGGFAAGTSCASLPADSFNFAASNGAFGWTPSLAAAVGGVSTTYVVQVTGADSAGATANSTLSITVVPGITVTMGSVTSTKVSFTWPNVGGALSYNIYKDADGSPMAAVTTTGCGGATCAYTASSLTPNTGYSFYVVAMNGSGVYSTSNTQSATTHATGTFTAIANLTVAEGATAQTANLSCTNALSSVQNFSITAQSDSDTNCSLTATSGATAKVSCSPGYRVTHTTWSAVPTVTVQCSMDDFIYTNILTLNVTDTNRSPLLSTISDKIVAAGSAISAIDVNDSHSGVDNDIDSDALLYGCTFSGGGFGAGTACSSLPNIAYSFDVNSGVLNWTPSYSAAVGGVNTVYSFSISGSDQQVTPLTSNSAFTVTVNSTYPVLTSLTNKLYPNNAVQGANVSFDVNNIASSSPGNDAGMSYACAFDATVDGAVNSGADCSTLPGFISFGSGTGALSWTPNSSATGQYEIKFSGTNVAGAATSIVAVDVRLSFAGITSISNISGSSMQLNWTANPGALGGYNIYSVSNTGSLTLNQTVVGAGSTNVVLTGLNTSTTYKWRVRAIDSLGYLDNNTTDLAANTLGSTFAAISNLTTTENTNVQTPVLGCSDTLNSVPAYAITSQSDANMNCSISGGNKVSCTPVYKTGHSDWSSTVTVQCTINGGTLNQTFTVTATDNNRAPALTAIGNQTITAGGAITAVNVNDSNSSDDTDIDIDTLSYTCTFSGGGFSAGTSCGSLPGSASFSASTGVLNWTSSAASAVSNSQTIYAVVITGGDQMATPLSDSKTFTVTVNPGVPVLTSLTSRVYPANPAIRSVNVGFDVNNIAAGGGGNDSGMTYACAFDATVDGAVGAGTDCSSLPGFISFSTSTSALSWTPNNSAVGQYEIKFTGTNSAGSATSIVSVDVRLNFGGITSVSNITTTSATLNWTAATGASGYYVYSVDGGGNLTSVQTVSNGAATSASITGLTDSTTYTYRVRAFDSLGNTDPNVVNQNVVTKGPDTFTTGTVSMVEGQTGTLDLSTKCSDVYTTGGRVYAFVSQTNASASPNCSVSGSTLSCTPPYINKNGNHSNWSESATATCAVNGTTYTQTFTVSVTASSIVPTAGNSTATGSPTSLTADGTTTTTITVTLIDGSANKAAGRTVTLSSDRGASDTISPASVVSDANGVATFTVKSTLAGIATLTAVDTTDAVTVTQKPAITFNAGVADHIVKIDGDSQTANVSAALSTNPKVQVVDRYGNGVSGTQVAFLPIQGGGNSSPSVVTTDASGFASTVFSVGANIINKLQAMRFGSILPNLGGGNSSVTFSESSTNLGVGTFSAWQYPSGGTTSYANTLADFNGDGILDAVVINYGSINLSILIGNGDGTFQTAVNYTTGSAPTAVTVADFNADGAMDIAVSSWSANKVNIFIGNKTAGVADGTFAAKVDYTTLSNPSGLATGDFNADGALDIAVVNYTSAKVSVLLGNKTAGVPNGTFAAKVDYTTGATPHVVAVKDFNADGKLDLAVTNYTGTSVSIFIGDGLGAFAAKVDYATAANPKGIAIGDYNADGANDLAIANYTGNSISILLGNKTAGVANGTFAAKVDYSTGTNSNPTMVQTTDLNGDGALDLVTATYSSDVTSVFIGNKTAGVANGTFAAKVDYPVGSSPSVAGFGMGDIDGDGKTDLVFALNGPNAIYPIRGNGDGTLQPFGHNAGTIYTTGAGPMGIVTGDFNADGALDYAVANYTPSTISIFLGNKTAGVPNGTFAAKVDYATSTNPRELIAVDLNGDGALDLVSGGYTADKISVLLGNKTAGVADGTFATKVDYNGVNTPMAIAVGDFNGDGVLDLLSANNTASTISIFTGLGDGTFSGNVSVITSGTNPYDLAVADFNGDGKQDFAVVNYGSNSVGVFIGNGNGTFQNMVSYTTPLNPTGITSGDFNGDGKLDLVTANYGASTISYFAGNGDGTFAAKVDVTAGLNARKLKAVDYNGDGKLDLIVNLYGAVAVRLFPGDGLGGFVASTMLSTGSNPYGVVVGDMNADGKADIGITAYTVGSMQIFIAK